MYVTKELDFINDTIKFVEELKLRYPNKNTMKSHLNSISSLSHMTLNQYKRFII